MRVAVSGSHSTGKSTLIASFLAGHPAYVHEPEAYESLADEVDLTASEGPTLEGLQALLEHSIAAVSAHPRGSLVLFERSPVDYLAYAAASRAEPRESVASFLCSSISLVRDAVRYLDVLVFLPVASNGVEARPGESPRFRRRVDEALRRAVVDDDYDLFGESSSPRVVELSPFPEHQLRELIQLAAVASGVRG